MKMEDGIGKALVLGTAMCHTRYQQLPIGTWYIAMVTSRTSCTADGGVAVNCGWRNLEPSAGDTTDAVMAGGSSLRLFLSLAGLS